MKAFALVSFWLAILGVFIRACYIVHDDYPRTEEKTSALDLLNVIINTAWALWAAYLIWG